MTKRYCTPILWCIPLSVFAADANAWGLYTHIYFAQWLLMATPLLDPKLQKVIEKFPTLVMAGACLPDLAIISKSFKTTHQWQKAEWMMSNASTDEEIAIAIGYTSHLFVDVVAHNHFVPAFEAKWKRVPWLNKSIVTHIASEWAMDAHIAQHIHYTPNQLIRMHMDELSAFVAPCFTSSGANNANFNLSAKNVRTQLKRLAWADFALRISFLSQSVFWVAKLKDKRFMTSLEYYLTKTRHALSHFNQSVTGNRPQWEPELKHLSASEMVIWREKCLKDLTKRLATPIHFYQSITD